MMDAQTLAPHLPGYWHDQEPDGLRGMPVRCENQAQLESWLRIHTDPDAARVFRDKVLIFARTEWEAHYWADQVGGIRWGHAISFTKHYHPRGVRTSGMPRVFLDGFWDNPQAIAIIRNFNIGELK